MEEQKPVENPAAPPPQPPNTNPQEHPPPPHPPTAPAMGAPPPRPAQIKKRPLETESKIQECTYFKMRAVIRDIRPHILDALQAVDFGSCNGVQELREKLKLLMEIYRQMTPETITITRSHTVLTDNETKQKPQEQLQNGKPADQIQTERHFAKPSEKQQADGDGQGTYIIGGSAFGWNFITFPGNTSTYYGRTKESFRAAQVSQ